MTDIQSPTIPVSTYGLRLLSVNIIGHPLDYVRFLIQIGHEPMEPYPARTIFGKSVMRLPSVLKYVEYIKNRDGWFGLYRGLVPKVCGHVIGSGATVKVVEHLELKGGRNLMDDPSLSDSQRFEYLLLTLQKVLVERFVFVSVSHPFIVVSARMMASFVGEEVAYSGVFSSIRQIFREDGLLGFFSGYLPRLAGDLAAVFISNVLIFTINNYMVKEKDLQTLTNAAFCYLINSQAHPFAVVSSCMTIDNTSLKAGQPPNMCIFSSWMDCWKHLRINNQLNRGAALFFRAYNGPPAGPIKLL